MKCSECEKNGLKLIRSILSEDQRILNKQRGSFKKEIEALKKKCYQEKGYFIIECETRQKLVPEKEKPHTRYECSNRHNWFIEGNNYDVSIL